MTPWYAFGWAESGFICLYLLAIYSVLGHPHGWLWLLVAPSLLLGKWLGSLWRRR